MTLHRQPVLLAAAMLGCGLLSHAAPAAAEGAQYCIALSGSNGSSSYVSNCIYSDYQQCTAAAVGSRGNCVGNVEYRGDAATGQGPRRRR